jgi:carboxyl-terminal processing protease
MPHNRGMKNTILALVVPWLLAAGLAYAQPAVDKRDETLPPPAASPLPMDEIRRYVAVFAAIQRNYVDEVGNRELMSAGLRGLLAELDPHSTYLDREALAAMADFSEGEYSGVGVELEERSDGVARIIAPIDGGPAARAGIRPGDIIIAIDGKSLETGDVDLSTRPLRGAAGTSVRVTVARDGVDEPLEFTLVREQINIDSVRSRMLEPGYGYVRISAFQDDTVGLLRRELLALEAQAGGRLRGLVLDLRSNPGGLLDAAVGSADLFLERGTILTMRGRLPSYNREYSALPGAVVSGTEIVVLVDAATASAAEVLAGALQDSERATLMGARTFGKGSVQSVFELDNGDGIKLTIARYFTPSGRSLQAAGLEPDIVLEGRRIAGLREQALPGHLQGEEEASELDAAGVILEGDAPITAALERLKSGARR